MSARFVMIFATLFSLTSSAFAQEVSPETADLPVDGALGFRNAASPLAEEVHFFHDALLLPVMVIISVFVLMLLVWVAIRYNSKANPVAQKFSHNTLVEVVWTLVPVLILILISLFSFDLLYLSDRMPDGQVDEFESGTEAASVPNAFVKSRRATRNKHIAVELVDKQSGAKILLNADGDYDVTGFGEEQMIITLARPVPTGNLLRVTSGRSRVGAKPFLGLFGEDKSSIIPAPTVTIKAVGFQWGWSYSYPDFGDFEFDSLIAPRETVSPELYRFATTNDIVVPVGETVRIVTAARDVIHAWAMPAFAVKVDAIPGRLNETWFYTDKEGVYYGQCSEICGIDHAFMPISVRVVSRVEFEDWIDERREFEGMDLIFAPQRQIAGNGSTADGDVLN